MHDLHPLSPAYEHLVERLNRFPQGAPPSDSLYRILNILFSEEEAELVSRLPIKPFTVEKAARAWQVTPDEARSTLDALADRAILLDMARDGETTYVLPPPMAGFFEFSMMRTRDDVDQTLLAELYEQYCAIEPEFMESLVATGETQLGRIFVNEPVLQPEAHVLDHERASHVICSASHIGISRCYCRFKKEEIGEVCDAPQDICMTFGGTAASLIKHGFAREVDVAEGLDLLDLAHAHNLVQFGENVREDVNFICNCCGCCCEALTAARRFAYTRPIHTTNFMPHVDLETCTGCGQCVSVCPIEAMGLVSAHDPDDPRARRARVDPELCLGCGVCARVCPTDSISIEAREERVITPFNSVHRIAMMALERDRLQDLIFDQQILWSHRAMATLLSVILKLPPVKRTLAQEQVKSRYLNALIRRFYGSL